MFGAHEPDRGWQCLPLKLCSRCGNLSHGRRWLAGCQRSPSSLQLSEAVKVKWLDNDKTWNKNTIIYQTKITRNTGNAFAKCSNLVRCLTDHVFTHKEEIDRKDEIGAAEFPLPCHQKARMVEKGEGKRAQDIVFRLKLYLLMIHARSGVNSVFAIKFQFR